MKLSFDIIESNGEIQQNILKALLPDCKDYMNNAINIIKKELPSIVFNAISNTPEYLSLISGKLKFEFGISDADIKVTNLLETWSKNIIYNYSPPSITGNRIKSSFSANAIKADFSDVLGSDDAKVQDIGGYELPWLRWLLLEGNAVLVRKHDVLLGPNTRSRTGFAIMTNSNKDWSVPSEFAGTQSDNWITRAIENARPDIDNLLNKAFSP
jgi:hypothetical protein